MKKVAFFTLFIFLLSSLSACSLQRIKIPFSAEEIIGSDSNVIVSELEKCGFSDISIEYLDDLSSKDIQNDETVATVSIDNNFSFLKSDRFSKNSRIIITVHNIRKIKIEESSNTLASLEPEKLLKKLESYGFFNIETEEFYDINPKESDIPFINSFTINGISSFPEESSFPYDSLIHVDTHYPYKEYPILLHIDIEKNLLFNKYDIDLYLDGEGLYTLAHGGKGDIELSVFEGNHTILFTKNGDPGIANEILITNVDSPINANINISCHLDYVEVSVESLNRQKELSENDIILSHSLMSFVGQKLNDVINLINENGFINVIDEPIYDITTKTSDDGKVERVSIDGCDTYIKGEILDKNLEVIITYHALEANSPENIAKREEQAAIDAADKAREARKANAEAAKKRKEEEARKAEEEARAAEEAAKAAELEKTFPHIMAVRAATVCITNGYALDVMTSDGNSYDTSKFHSFSDSSGNKELYYFHLISEGTATAYNENTWKITGLQLRKAQSYGARDVNATILVSYDGKQYIIKSIAGSFGNNDLKELMYDSEILSIPSKLVSNGR